MASVTTNYQFDVPTSSDLVKNGATAISTLGQDIDTFLFRPFTCNGVINGGFDWWQRGTSFSSNTLNGYCADRWKYVRAANTAGITISQVASPQTGFQYGIKQQRTASNTSTDATYLAYGLETKDFLRFAGQTVTLSFYGVKGANFSGVLSLYFATGTGTDENPLAALTGESILYNSSVSLTTTVARYSVTFDVPSAATSDRFYFSWAPTGTAGADDSFTITGVQLEQGSQVSPFVRAGGTIQGELAACQRYYWRTGGSNTFEVMGSGYVAGVGTGYPAINFPVAMRTTPSSIDYSTLSFSPYGAAGGGAITALALQSAGSGKLMAILSATLAGGCIATQFYNLTANNSTSAYLGFSAEL